MSYLRKLYGGSCVPVVVLSMHDQLTLSEEFPLP